ncbi:protein POLLEN DEFECTIVE IN GUIDANCE 1-like isoform X1 [Cucurbita pepo subsp. pepo]|uniref:protein POLLEN DEFECTIVE IN GUIDANCE 1-like isoform X1 n=1 Tax=Cucurbita pepo subsp. pepo TaxID=3664 RepID=UPI000C9D9DB0|nr:protein POLLEN DEFECTIVE IN GUIDANCE 1-like isoform X1 [Cucurbita pepo subsp. pepo]
MELRSGGRKLSFDVLRGSGSSEDDRSLILGSKSDLVSNGVEDSVSHHSIEKPNRKKKRHRGSKKNKAMTMTAPSDFSIPEEPIADKCMISNSVFDKCEDWGRLSENRGSICTNRLGLELNFRTCSTGTVVCEELTVPEESRGSVSMLGQTTEVDCPNLRNERFIFGELRQRTVNGDDASSRFGDDGNVESCVETNSGVKQKSEPNGNVVQRLETAGSLDWKRLMAQDPYTFSADKSPVKSYMEEMFSGNSLRITTTFGNEKERERVYDTIFRLPWRCELLIDVGFFVCLDSFLSLLTVMPTRILITLWKLFSTRTFGRLSSAELSDFGCFLIMASGVALLELTDISLIYHMIRGQGTIKLYVVYNVLEIFDKLFQSFGGDVLQTLFNSAEGLANSPPENMGFWIGRFISDQVLAVAASIVHSFILLVQAITLSTCIVAHNNALLALLVSNNFAEIKSNVFKRYSKDNIHSLVYFDSIERFHILAFLLFVLAQNILEAEGPWFGSFLYNALMVFICEMLIDIIKHSFLAKFNGIKPIAYSEFLEDLCKQALNMPCEDAKKNLTFVPVAPACVVIRVLTPVYAALLPYNPLPWRFLSVPLLFGVTYVMLISLKILVGLSLQKYATWYINRCRKKKHHLHAD